MSADRIPQIGTEPYADIVAQDVSVGVNVFGIHPITVPNRRNCPPIGIVASRCHNFHPVALSPKRLFRATSDRCKPWQFQFFRADAVPTKNRLVKSDIEPEFTNIRASFAIFRNETSRSQSAGRVMCRLPAFPADMGIVLDFGRRELSLCAPNRHRHKRGTYYSYIHRPSPLSSQSVRLRCGTRLRCGMACQDIVRRTALTLLP